MTDTHSAPVPPDAAPRCAHCRHPRRDHDGRADQRERYSPTIAGGPWCHACNTACDYAPTTAAPGGLREEITKAAEDAITAWDAEVPGTEGHPLHVVVAAGMLPVVETHLARRAEEAETALARMRAAWRSARRRGALAATLEAGTAHVEAQAARAWQEHHAAQATLARVRDYAETSDDDGPRTRQHIRQLLDGAPAEPSTKESPR
ncbi:hypothetical protein D7231_31950 [Streptomyces klenkii]|uniref:Uncharacterized protein n=1 Tax=Streptomyces klenkii TaxID=1420899 RepID=A0A3B0ARC5_9ACTN|nr:hypothetical protein [Streptomyces klenkii]RKN61886.1 hypothetical protein D7231_31950 [Streptomyces klenkii]